MTGCLIFDADDTLWENNIYFQRAVQDFLDLVAPFAPDRRQALHLLTQIERESIPQRGYGTRNFLDSLRETFLRLYTGDDGVAYLRGIEEIGDRLYHHDIELLPGVAATLELLQPRYRLLLFTKGDREEQQDKLNRSGLNQLFDRVEVVAEKNTTAYQELIRCHQLSQESTMMIGNSPRSDVLPALAAGLWAVFIPHPHTWEFEEEVVEPHPRLLVARSFPELPLLLDSPRAPLQA